MAAIAAADNATIPTIKAVLIPAAPPAAAPAAAGAAAIDDDTGININDNINKQMPILLLNFILLFFMKQPSWR